MSEKDSHSNNKTRTLNQTDTRSVAISFEKWVIYFMGFAFSLGYAALAISQVVSVDLNGLAVSFAGWDQLGLNERGDFLAGFFAPLIMIWTIVAIFLQRIALNLQRRDLQEQTKIFNAELRNLERSDVRAFMKSLERQLEHHAAMIRELIDGAYTRDSDSPQIDEIGVLVTSKFVRELSEQNFASDAKNAKRSFDRMCTYINRFKELEKRCFNCGIINEYNAFYYYTSYGRLANIIENKLSALTKKQLDGYKWKWDYQSKTPVFKK
jgi:hypothetical protein